MRLALLLPARSFFLRGIIRAGCGFRCRSLAITDRNSLAGIVRAHEAAKFTGVRLIVGCRLDLVDGSAVLVYPPDRAAYAGLCRMLSLGKRRGGKARCMLSWEDLAAYAEGLIGILVPGPAGHYIPLNFAASPRFSAPGVIAR